MSKGKRLTKENCFKIDAKKLNDDCKMVTKTKMHGRSMSNILSENGLSTSVISNSTRAYWIHCSGEEGAKVSAWGPFYGRVAFIPGYTKGFIKHSDFAKILKIFDLKAADYLIEEDSITHKLFIDKPFGDFTYEEYEESFKCGSDLKEIKELIGALNEDVRMLYNVVVNLQK